MITTYATGLIVLSAVLGLWVLVQNAWRRAFPHASEDADVLAGRLGCQVCEQNASCERPAPAGALEEESA